MHLTERAYVLLIVTAALWLASVWTADPLCSLAWPWTGFALLAGISWEGFDLRALRLSAHIDRAARLFLGRTTPAALAIATRPARDIDIELALASPAGIEAQSSRFLHLSTEQTEVAPLTLTAVSLGTQRWPASAARVRGRLGLAWWDKTLPLEQTTHVAPDARRVARRRVPGVTGIRPRRVAGAGSELHQLRAYAPGDPPARIDWKASARCASLMTRELSEDQHLEVVIAIDAGRLSRIRTGVLDRLSVYGNVAARLAAGAVTHDDRIGLVVYADRVMSAVPPARGAAALLRIRSALERLDAQSAESEPLVAAMQIRALLRHRGLVVLLTDLDDATIADQLDRTVRILSPPHQVIVAGVESRTIEALAQRPARDWLDPYIGLAAREHQARALAQRALLRRIGVPVVTAREEKLGEAVFEEYERLRRQRRI